MSKQFSMSMYATKEQLYKAKSDYYLGESRRLSAALDKLWDIQKYSGMDEVDRGAATYTVLAVVMKGTK